MKKRELIKSLAMTALGCGASLLFSTRASAGSAPPAGKGLAVGQSLRFDDGLKLVFVGVRHDNRCPLWEPAEPLCLDPGDAEVLLLAYVGKQPAKVIRVHTFLEPSAVVLSAVPRGMIGIPKTYSVSVVSLSPFRRLGKKDQASGLSRRHRDQDGVLTGFGRHSRRNELNVIPGRISAAPRSSA